MGKNMKNAATYAVGHGIGAGVAEINQLRSNQLLANLRNQDMNLENALNELAKIREFCSPANHQHILGSVATKHGEVAEHIQVGFANADRFIVGDQATHTFEGVGRLADADYLKNGLPVQSKFVQTDNSFSAVAEHLNKYPDFLAKGGTYDIPADHYEQIQEWLSLSTDQLNKLPKSANGNVARRVVEKIRKFELENNVKFEDVVNPAQISYDEAQLSAVEKTIAMKEGNIKDVDLAEREKFRMAAKATIKQGAQVAAISAAIEGVTNFGVTVLTKYKQGKKIGDFTEDDWKEIFANTGTGALKGGVRGASVYALTNLTKANATVATSIVTVTFGAISLTTQFARGQITSREYADSLQQLGAETGVTAAGAAIGQALIPVPVVGALVGSLVGSIILGDIQRIAANHLQGSQFLVDIESAYAGTAEVIYESTQTYLNALQVLAKQHEDFAQKKKLDNQLTGDLTSLLDSI